MAVATMLIMIVSIIWGSSCCLLIGFLAAAVISDRFRLALLGEARPRRRLAAEGEVLRVSVKYNLHKPVTARAHFQIANWQSAQRH